ncbi:hypothetical protein [Pontibacter harenae]|uniref:hypothetical protein n=1 Tax=Pontibacter harenae TaxID=2894083 RepID=UPI001E4B3A34|nr:hypothetical protein [Pontibacter harenae]MCC9167600.1 hypothetical protein [Pontibacter harenae]
MSITSNPFETLLPRAKPLPAAIHKRVTRAYGELIFHGKRIEDGKLIRILNEAYDEHRNRTGSHIIPFFTKYSEGVLEGMRHDFIPFIDTPDNRKELIINEVTQEIYLFPNVKSDDKEEEQAYLSEYMYHYGKQVGKLYKAWCIVVQNPDFFLPDFIALDQQSNSENEALKGPNIFTKFEDLFYDSRYIEASLNILRKIEPAAVDENNFYIGKLKGVISVWQEELEKAKIIKPIHNAYLLAQFLNKKFPGLNIARSTLYSISGRANQYRMELRGMVLEMKTNLR